MTLTQMQKLLLELNEEMKVLDQRLKKIEELANTTYMVLKADQARESWSEADHDKNWSTYADTKQMPF